MIHLGAVPAPALAGSKWRPPDVLASEDFRANGHGGPVTYSGSGRQGGASAFASSLVSLGDSFAQRWQDSRLRVGFGPHSDASVFLPICANTATSVGRSLARHAM